MKWGSINIKKRERGGVVKRNVDPYVIRVVVKRRERKGRKFKERKALPDENYDADASVRGITKENARQGVGAIRTQSREFRNLEKDKLRLDSWIQKRSTGWD